MNKSSNLIAYIYLLLTVTFWAGNFIVGKFASFYEVPQNLLTSKKYAKNVYQLIQEEKLPTKATVNIIESEETTHFSILDKWGNAVSNTYTLNTAYGSGIIPTGTGILMNNEMDDFSSKPGYPNVYGLIGSEANKIEPKTNTIRVMGGTTDLAASIYISVLDFVVSTGGQLNGFILA